MASDDKAIRQVLREERSRGRTPPTPEEIYKARLKRLKDFRKALKEDNWELLKKQLSASGLVEGSEKWNEALAIWNQYHGYRYRE